MRRRCGASACRRVLGSCPWPTPSGRVAPSACLVPSPPALLDTIRDISDRPAFGEFKPIEIRAAARGELPRGITRALAIALLDKMREESATITKIVQHRRGRD